MDVSDEAEAADDGRDGEASPLVCSGDVNSDDDESVRRSPMETGEVG